MLSAYAEEMLDAEMDKFADHPQADFAKLIISSVKDALFGPPTKEVAGTCGSCGGVADSFGEDFCRACWGS